jgi:Asp-tRNA(Asn)/Glu-tRNA(Gln) amidotransferase A subunit family amidase
MAKTTADLAMAMNILAGHDSRDSSTSEAPVPNYLGALTKNLEGFAWVFRTVIILKGWMERLTPQ